MRFLLIIPILVIILVSCDENRVYEEIVSIKNETWNFKDSLHFDVNISDTVNPFNVLINIRNAGSYQYSNIFLFITTHAPNGISVKDTFEIALADKSGKWFGSGTGNLFNYQAYYKRNIKFPYRGIYMFDIQHAMWNEELKGISDVGLRLETVK